jgi:tetratricopeptide (TPR) repeat protein
MKDAADKIEKSYVDDYSQMLPIFRIPNSPESKASYADLEKAIKKATLVIERHAITNRSGEEISGAVKWIDENYIIIGQARYYRAEFVGAEEIFDYVIQKYPGTPSQSIAMMWKARTEVQLGNYSLAESLLDVVNADKSLSKTQEGEVKTSYADLYMHTGNYPNAIKYLNDAIPLTKSKKLRARYNYILAQLYEQTGDFKKSADAFSMCISLNPRYDMLFNAKLNQARLSANTATNRTAAKRELEKMLLDEKNAEFRDQIYYSLAELEKKNNKTEAMKYYVLSVSSSQGNNKQKALSYLALGDLNFEAQNYKEAGAYYDSTMMFLPKDYKTYNAIDDKRKSLSNLVRYLNIISTEDSLQKVVRVYGGDTTTLYGYIDKKIEAAKQEEERKKKEQEEKIQNGGSNTLVGNNNNQQNNQQQQAGMWYFYNPSTVGFGVGEFNKKWGNNRKLEDNWRRNNKEQFIEEVNPEGVDTSKKGSNKIASNQTRDFYLRNLPLTPELLAKSDEAIADALYNLGGIYKDQMGNMPKAIEAYEALAARYPNHKYALVSHFQLYRIFQKTGDKAKEQRESDFICKNYPESDYCQLIKNPQHEVNVLAEREKVRIYYDSTYVEYTRSNYAAVVQRSNYADSVFGTKHEHAAKFAYIRALSLGKTQGTPQMESALVKLISQFPKDPIKPQAQLMLDFIRKSKNPGGNVPVDTGSKTTTTTYKINEKTPFQYMVIVKKGSADVNKFRTALSDFNTQNYGSSGLTITTLEVDPTHTAVMVKSFTDQSAAMSYYNNLKGHPDLFSWLGAGNYQTMVISTENFGTFLRNKDTEGYKKFFDENILKKSN